MPKQKRSRLLLGFVTIIILLCGALLFGGIMTTYLHKFNDTLEEENRIRMAETGENIRVYMNAVVDGTQKSLDNVAAAWTALPETDRMPYLEQMVSHNDFVYIGCADQNGNLYTTLSPEKKDISGESYFQDALAGEHVVTGVVHEILKDSAASGVLLASPLPDGAGVLVAMLDLRQLETVLETKSFGGEGYSYIIDSSGELVLYKRSMDYYNFFNLMENVTFEEGFSYDVLHKDIETGQAGLACYSNFDVKKHAYYCPLGINDWTVINEVAKDVITQKTDMLAYELTTLCVGVVAAFIVLTLMMAILYNQSQLRKRETQAKSAFLSNMSHDMRTPMNGIVGMTAIAKKNIEDREKVLDCLNKVELSSGLLLGLINDVLDMSKIESGKLTLRPEPFDMEELVLGLEAMIQPQCEAKGLELKVSHRIRHRLLVGDTVRLTQIFMNLLSNAVKFTHEGGTITVTAEEPEQRRAGFAVSRLTVADSGIGMSPEFLKVIFTPFERAADRNVHRVEGAGLGMAITKNLVTAMGGRITVKSEPGHGSTFTVELELPLQEAGEPERQEERPPAEDFDLAGRRFLLAEDNAINREIAVEILREYGAQVETAENGALALEKFRQSEPGDYDAVLMDIQMPVMDGYQAARTIRKSAHPRAHSIPIIAMTANAFEEDVRAALDAGMDAHVAKPIDVDKLCRVLAECIEKAKEK